MNFSKFVKSFKANQQQIVTDVQLTEAERLLINDIRDKFVVTESAKTDKVTTWNNCISAYNSDYFKNANRPDYKSDEISNFIFSTLETIKPIMIDNDPRILVLPKTPEGMQVSDKIQNAFDAEWTRAGMSKKLAQGITIALQIGTAIFGMFWNGKDENGLGNVNPVLINPFNFFPDPMAVDVDGAEYIIYATYKHVNQLKMQFPSKAHLLRGGAINHPELVPQGNISDVANQVLIFECYMRDYTTEEAETIDQDNENKKLKVNVKKYPKGRIVTIAPELDLLLDDKANPYQDGKFPFKVLKCYDVPFEFWGKSEIEQLLSPQTYINDLTNQVIDNAKLTANMPWVIDKNSGIGKGQLTNRPGLIIRKNPGTMVDRLNPPQMPQYVQEIIQTLKNDIEIISGVHDVTQGRKPGSVTAANAIIALQEAAQARIRLKVKLMEITLGEIGTMWYNRMQQFWVTNRWIRRSDYAEVLEAQKNPETALMQVSPADLEANMDFMILAGSTMPQNKNAMLDLMIRLAQTPGEDGLPMVDRETLLAYTNIPDKKKIISRFEKMNATRSQAAAQKAQAEQMMLQEEQKQKMAIAMMISQATQVKAQTQAQTEIQKEVMKTQSKTNDHMFSVKEQKEKREHEMSQQQMQMIADLVIEKLRASSKNSNNSQSE